MVEQFIPLPPAFMNRRAFGVSSRRVLALLGATLVLACGGNTRSSPFGSGRAAPAEPAQVVVENRYWSDMTIYVDRAGSRSRLGTVSTNQTRTFELSPVVAPPGASVAFVADPVGSADTYSSPRTPVVPGDRYRWTLAVELAHSTLVRR